jgi:uncharacterized protein YjbI with pentapeptide repeats
MLIHQSLRRQRSPGGKGVPMHIRASLVLLLAISSAVLGGQRAHATTVLPCPSVGAQPRSSATIESNTDHFCEDWSGVMIPSISGVNELISVNLGSASLRGAVIEPQMAFFDLEGADLRDARITSLPESNLRNADLSRITGTGDWAGTDLTSAVARDAFLGGIHLDFSNLTFADLTGTDLSLATFRGTQIYSTNLSGVNLAGASTLSDAIFGGTTLYDADTIFPDGFDPVAYGLTFVPEPGTALLVTTGVLGLAASRRRRANSSSLAPE